MFAAPGGVIEQGSFDERGLPKSPVGTGNGRPDTLQDEGAWRSSIRRNAGARQTQAKGEGGARMNWLELYPKERLCVALPMWRGRVPNGLNETSRGNAAAAERRI